MIRGRVGLLHPFDTESEWSQATHCSLECFFVRALMFLMRKDARHDALTALTGTFATLSNV